MNGFDTPGLPPSRPVPRNDSRSFQAPRMGPPNVRKESKIDPSLGSTGQSRTVRTHEPGYNDAIKAWSRFRFVRAGWFTPIEAIDYLE
jgi:hypothetical protein